MERGEREGEKERERKRYRDRERGRDTIRIDFDKTFLNMRPVQLIGETEQK